MSETKARVPWMTILAGILLAAFSSSVGFGISQTTIVAEVSRHGINIQHLQEADKSMREDEVQFRTAMRAEMLQFRMEFTDRIKLLVDTINAQTATTRDLITLVRLQQGVKP